MTSLRLEANTADGLVLRGSRNKAARNTAADNGQDGLRIEGDRATVDRNQATDNGAAGLEIHGTGHKVTQNAAQRNRGAGLEVVATTGGRLDRNSAENGGSFGITDDSAGGGTSGTANDYSGNICGRGNAAGASSPAGLCR